jgi:hypothetical protein
MALPADINTITVTGTYKDVSGAALSGSVAFVPSTPLLVDTVGKALLSGGAVSVALSAGTFSQSLPCTGQMNPAGWTWTVAESITGLPARSYSISIPHSLGSTVDLTAVSP